MKFGSKFWGILSLGFLCASPAAAQIPTPPLPGCQYSYDQEPRSHHRASNNNMVQSYDGAGIKSPSQLAEYSKKAGNETITINGGDFSDWNFSSTKLSNICFVDVDLSRSNWSNMTAPGLGFINSNAEAANMSGAKMQDILIRNSRFLRVNAKGATWSSGKLDGGWDGDVRQLNIDGADLTGFLFDCGITVSDGCPLSRDGISARGTNLAFADISRFNFYDADVTGAILNQTIISPRQLTHFERATNMGAVFLAGGTEKVILLPETWLIFMASASAAEEIDQPSFRCDQAATKVEREICGEYNSQLRKLDRQISALYSQVRKGNRKAKADQKAWLKRRNSCAAKEYLSDCLRESYDQRKGELIGLLGESNWLAADEEALFVEEVLPLTEELVQSQSFVQLTPILAGAARSSLLITRNLNGSLRAYGEAIGANAHICNLDVDGLRFDPLSGWYSLTAEVDGKMRRYPVLRYSSGQIDIYRNGKLRAEDQLPDDDYISCGARASFPALKRLAVPDAIIARYREAAKAQR
ncbi:MAG: hypothetical protein ABJO01_02975 [Parasphingorhabdus sp.]|uniref:hypothetical protein n=1 Tax=Parasphingorhabdus sp. TaxID=2709688 RepID=UPI0032983DC3